MKSLTMLWKVLALDLASWCGTCATRDIKTVTCRSEHEGLSFLTITLANFGKDFERSLDQGYVDRNLFQGFTWQAGLPRFLGGFLDQVFDRCGGTLLTDPSIEAIRAIRQLTLVFGKLHHDCTNDRVAAALDGFVECDRSLEVVSNRLNEADYARLSEASNLLFGNMLDDLDQRVFDRSLYPKHGPGVTADRLLGNRKYDVNVWPHRLSRSFPPEEYLTVNSNFWNELESVQQPEPGAEIPMRVVTVPKTLKAPRIIGIEPTALQFAQQAIRAELYESVEKDFLLRRMIRFTDQTPNQVMAREGSSTGELATLDLSEASDRVLHSVAEAVIGDRQHLLAAINDCRSLTAEVPERGIIPLLKFAPMGSALCFPMEAMVFLAIIFLAIAEELNVPLSRKLIRQYSTRVRVYGDDIIIPIDMVHPVIRSLEYYGAKVNRHKSFWTGKFRESCGKEYFDGEDVSIVRVREMLPASRADATGVIATVALRNQLYLAGRWKTVQWLDGWISRVISHYPVVLPTSPVQGRWSFLGFQPGRFNASLHRPEVKGWVEMSRPPVNQLDGHGALLKCLLSLEERSRSGGFIAPGLDVLDGDEDHLKRSGRPPTVSIKLGWHTPY